MLEQVTYQLELHQELTEAENDLLDYFFGKYEEVLKKQDDRLNILMEKSKNYETIFT
jgi:hypothetical protein